MTVYWLLFTIPAFATLFPRRLLRSQQLVIWTIVGCLFILLIGLRFEVGGDWQSYIEHFQAARHSLLDALDFGDPAYYLAGWFFASIGGSVYWLNTFCAALLVGGVMRFASIQPRPWLALAVAVPYLLIVVGMGYTRQAAAIGLAMWGLVALRERRVLSFAVSILLAALFHKTALLMLPIAALAASRRRIWTATWVGVLFVGGFFFLLQDQVDTLYSSYIDSEYAFASEGARIRLAMNAVAAAIFLLFRRRLSQDLAERRLYGWMSLITMASVPLLTISPTAVDRMALYLIPLQLVVFSRLPDLATTGRGKQFMLAAAVGYYALVQFVWLNYASHAFAWLPYQFAPLVGVF